MLGPAIAVPIALSRVLAGDGIPPCRGGWRTRLRRYLGGKLTGLEYRGLIALGRVPSGGDGEDDRGDWRQPEAPAHADEPYLLAEELLSRSSHVDPVRNADDRADDPEDDGDDQPAGRGAPAARPRCGMSTSGPLARAILLSRSERIYR